MKRNVRKIPWDMCAQQTHISLCICTVWSIFVSSSTVWSVSLLCSWRNSASLAIWNVPGWSGPSCSKLTTSLVNDSLKFTLSDTQICWNFLLKKCELKLLTFFQQKISEYCILNPLKQLMKWPLLVKLTMLWTTGPWVFARHKSEDIIHTAALIDLLVGQHICCSQAVLSPFQDPTSCSIYTHSSVYALPSLQMQS